MSGTISGCIFDAVSGERLTTPAVRLNRIGVIGEARGSVDHNGCFSFRALSPGEYSLGIYDSQYVRQHRRIVLDHAQPAVNLEIPLTLGGFLSGSIVDEDGRPPERCWFTLLHQGERRGKAGYISEYGADHATEDGTFRSSPLHEATYLLRISGILRKPQQKDSSQPQDLPTQNRAFDFLYPNARQLADAIEIPIRSGQKISDLRIQVPRPAWRTVRGKVVGALPPHPANIHVNFAWDIGEAEIGGRGGTPIQPDGSFEFMAQTGRYTLELCEYSPRDANDRTRLIRRLSTESITIGDRDLTDVQIPVSEPGN